MVGSQTAFENWQSIIGRGLTNRFTIPRKRWRSGWPNVGLEPLCWCCGASFRRRLRDSISFKAASSATSTFFCCSAVSLSTLVLSRCDTVPQPALLESAIRTFCFLSAIRVVPSCTACRAASMLISTVKADWILQAQSRVVRRIRTGRYWQIFGFKFEFFQRRRVIRCFVDSAKLSVEKVFKLVKNFGGLYVVAWSRHVRFKVLLAKIDDTRCVCEITWMGKLRKHFIYIGVCLNEL